MLTDKEEAINIQSLMMSRSKYCRTCDAVVLGSGVRRKKTDPPTTLDEDQVPLPPTLFSFQTIYLSIIHYVSYFLYLHCLDVFMNRLPLGPIMCHLSSHTHIFHVVIHTCTPSRKLYGMYRHCSDRVCYQ